MFSVYQSGLASREDVWIHFENHNVLKFFMKLYSCLLKYTLIEIASIEDYIAALYIIRVLGIVQHPLANENVE